MKDIKRRSFLKSIVGGLTALFVGVPKAKTKQGASPIYPAYCGWLEDDEDELVYKFLETQLKNTPISSIEKGIRCINGVKYNYTCFGIGFANAINREKERNYRIWECEDGEYAHYSVLDMRMHSIK